MRKYINEAHRNYSEALQKEIAEMSRNPLSAAEKETQMRRNRQLPRERAEGRNIPNKVTKRDLREAADAYEKAHENINDETGYNLYRFVRGVLKHGFYTYKDALLETMFNDAPSPNPDDFE